MAMVRRMQSRICHIEYSALLLRARFFSLSLPLPVEYAGRVMANTSKVQRSLSLQHVRQGKPPVSYTINTHTHPNQRKFTCIYTDRDPASPDGRPPAKRRAIDDDDEIDSPLINDLSTSNTPSNGQTHPSPLSPRQRRSSANQRLPAGHLNPLGVKQETPFKSPAPRPTIELPGSAAQLPTSHANGDQRHAIPSRATTVNSGPDEEAVIYSQSRMLQDPTGRVLYIGDSATLSFLQLLRMMVETVAGSSLFTNGAFCSPI